MGRWARCLAAALGCVLTVAVGSLPQRPFSSRTLGVRVDVLVTERGKPVAGLATSDFELRDNGVLQKIEATEAVDVPVNAVLALDTSGSTAGRRLLDLTAASRRLLDLLTPADRAALTSFSHVVAPRLPLTSDLAALRAALDRITASGQTSILDGIHAALTATLAEAGRSLLIVCTDGRDTDSWLQPDEVLESARRSNAVIYTVASGGSRRWSLLEDLANATGGRTMEVTSGGDIGAQFEQILREFRSRYLLTFSPNGVSPEGFHRLEVRVRRNGTTVKARPGYIASRTGSAE